MKKQFYPKGFTVLELLVVILIIGILASLAVPRYQKTVETSKAEEAKSLLQMVYSANKMYVLNNCPANQNCYCTSLDGATRAPGVCSSPTPPAPTNLVLLNYIQNLNSPARSYVYEAANGVAAGSYAAKATRGPGASAPYNGWRYEITKDGVVSAFGGAPPP